MSLNEDFPKVLVMGDCSLEINHQVDRITFANLKWCNIGLQLLVVNSPLAQKAHS